MTETAGCLDVSQGSSARLKHPPLAVWSSEWQKQELWRTCPPHSCKVWQATLPCPACSLLWQHAACRQSKGCFCPVASFAAFEVNSTWRFFDAHHFLWSSIGMLTGALVSRCNERLLLIKTFLNATSWRSLMFLKTTYLSMVYLRGKCCLFLATHSLLKFENVYGMIVYFCN